MAQDHCSTAIKPPADARVELRRPLPIADLASADVRLDLAYRYWQGLHVDHNLLPNRGGVDHAAFRFLVHDTVWINVESADPTNWDLVKLQAPSTDRAMAGTPVLTAQGVAWHEALLADCRTVRFTGTPLLQKIGISNPLIKFDQLILPLADDGIRVDTLLIVTATSIDQAALEVS